MLAIKVMDFGSFCYRGKLGLLNGDDICMCVVNKQLKLLEFVSDSVYMLCCIILQCYHLYCGVCVLAWCV